MSERFTTPVGRLVQGDPFKAQDKDQNGQPRVVKSGPNIGQPNPQFFIALAIPKTVADWKQEPDPFFQTVLAVGTRDFPGGQSAWPQFAWKIIDGDSPAPNQKGKPWNTIEGYPGHWVCRFASSYPPKCFSRQIGYDATQQITDPNYIRRGHYLTVNGSVSGNGNTTGNPGVYLNLDLISWEGYGPEIVSGPDAAGAFAQAPALPAGVSAAPVVPVAGAPVAPAQPAPPPVAPVQTAAVPHVPTPAAAPVPYTGYMQTPPAPPPAPPVSAVPAPMMLPAAGGATYEQMIAVGWTDATLIQQGMMAA